MAQSPRLRLVALGPRSNAQGVPRGWHVLCGSDQLAHGAVQGFSFEGRRGVLFRGALDGRVRALDARCPHLGASLTRGQVVDDTLACPLHRWRFDGEGHRVVECAGVAHRHGEAYTRTWPVAEQMGLIFVHLGGEPIQALPRLSFMQDASLRWTRSISVALRCSWQAVIANAFDIEHLATVHGREPLHPPELERLDAGRVRMRYVSRVTGRGASDRVMRWLSGGRIDVTITCQGGSVLVVESRTRRTASVAVVGVRPDGEHTRVTAAFSTQAPFGPLGREIARWLFSAFMRRDVAILEDMELATDSPHLRDPQLRALFAYLAELPRASHDRA